MYDDKKIPHMYAKVLVKVVDPDHLDNEIDIPTLDGDMYLRSVVGK
jgi:hypothetical protein